MRSKSIIGKQSTNAILRLAVLGVALLTLVPSAHLLAQQLPIGIPAPPFGFTDSHEMYANAANYTTGEFGPFTHYVDNTSPSCSDSFNDGTADNPRCSIPTGLDAGDVVEVHGGPYVETAWFFEMSGTREAPIFVRGIDDGNGFPVLDSSDPRNGRVYLDGSYGLIENLRLDTTGFRMGVNSASDHLAGRALDINWHQKSCVVIAADYSLISESEIHHCRDSEKDRHGVQVTPGTDYTWILNNHIHHNSGNGVQYTHQAESDPPDFVFVGGNHIHSDREVAVATKWAGRTVVSSNIIHSYKPSRPRVTWCYDDDTGCMKPAGGSTGPGIIIGADGYPLEKWVIYNVIYDTNQCIRNEKSIKARIIGNICANIEASGILLEKLSEDMYVVNNTFFNIGIDGKSAAIQQAWRNAFDLNVQNNLFFSPAGPALRFDQVPVMKNMEFNNNLMWNGGSKIRIRWKKNVVSVGSIVELERSIQRDLAEMSGNLVTDPGLPIGNRPSPTFEDFIPPDNSPLEGGGSNVLLQLDAEFKASFGDDVTIIRNEWRDHVFDIGAVPAGYASRH